MHHGPLSSLELAGDTFENLTNYINKVYSVSSFHTVQVESEVRMHKKVRPGLKLNLVSVLFSTATKKKNSLDWYSYFIFIFNVINILNFCWLLIERNIKITIPIQRK